jgi:multisubunit Na+/H+ antiporter MnhC subunit
VVTDVLLTVAAYLWLHRKDIVELIGLVLIVVAVALFNPIAGVLAAGIALILAANYAGR